MHRFSLCISFFTGTFQNKPPYYNGKKASGLTLAPVVRGGTKPAINYHGTAGGIISSEVKFFPNKRKDPVNQHRAWYYLFYLLSWKQLRQ